MGTHRKLDKLGRIAIPSDFRNQMGAKPGDPLEIIIEGNRITVVKYRPGCIFTGDTKGPLIEYCGQKVSVAAIREMAAIAEII
ncbi:MAG: AbrB/MazE/SpoVT family DNA-binding domain-containing protein [Clostridiales bacterium]|nr:AbrB/MazE/SpoVT family DNA-binding domain-containing protein [Clostridiales bacterium]